MKTVYRNLAIITIFIYIICIFALGYYLTVGNQTDMLIKNVPEVVYFTFVLILAGLVSFLLLFLGNNSKIDVVYVSETGETKDKNVKSNQSQTENQLSTSKRLDNIEALITQNQFNKKNLLENILKYVCNYTEASIGVIYILKSVDDVRILEMSASYALYNNNEKANHYKFGEGIVGQVAKNGKLIKITSIPENYIEVVSGLGKAAPTVLFIIPIKNTEDDVLGVMEIATFKEFNEDEQSFLEEVALLLAKEIETNEYQSLSV